MSAQATAVSSGKTLWAGRVISALPVLLMVFSAIMKLSHKPELVKSFVEQFGYQESVITPIALLELGSAVLYAIPQTSVLGAVLITGYFGGAIATHLRVGDVGHLVTPIVLAMLAWLGLYLRDVRLRALLPLRKT